MKVVINKCYGGFGLSVKAIEMISELKGWNLSVGGYSYGSVDCLKDGKPFYVNEYFYDKRSDKDLIKVIEEIGEESFGNYSQLSIVEIPDDVDYIIEEYDGKEWISEKHRTWY